MRMSIFRQNRAKSEIQYCNESLKCGSCAPRHLRNYARKNDRNNFGILCSRSDHFKLVNANWDAHLRQKVSFLLAHANSKSKWLLSFPIVRMRAFQASSSESAERTRRRRLKLLILQFAPLCVSSSVSVAVQAPAAAPRSSSNRSPRNSRRSNDHGVHEESRDARQAQEVARRCVVMLPSGSRCLFAFPSLPARARSPHCEQRIARGGSAQTGTRPPQLHPATHIGRELTLPLSCCRSWCSLIPLYSRGRQADREEGRVRPERLLRVAHVARRAVWRRPRAHPRA